MFILLLIFTLYSLIFNQLLILWSVRAVTSLTAVTPVLFKVRVQDNLILWEREKVVLF